MNLLLLGLKEAARNFDALLHYSVRQAQDHVWKHEEPLALKKLGVATLSTLYTISTVCFANRLLFTPQTTTRK